MFVEALVVRFVGALQPTWLQKLHPDVRVSHLFSEVVVALISDMVSSTAGSVFTLSSSSLAIWLSLARIVRVEFSCCMKDVFKPFLMMKLAETVSIFSLALNRMGSHLLTKFVS